MHNMGSFISRGVESAGGGTPTGVRVHAVTCSRRLEEGSGWSDRHERSSVKRRDRRRPWKNASGGRQVRRNGAESDEPRWGTVRGTAGERNGERDHGDRGGKRLKCERERERERSGIARRGGGGGGGGGRERERVRSGTVMKSERDGVSA